MAQLHELDLRLLALIGEIEAEITGGEIPATNGMNLIDLAAAARRHAGAVVVFDAGVATW